MTEKLARNGWQRRTLSIDGLTVAEVEFYPEEGFPLCVGYMVGEDDGKSMLHVTPEKAIATFRGASDRENGNG